MAWTVLSDATLEVGKALRALTMRNLRDNITALANGDAGAPQIQTAAIAASAVTAAKIAAGNVVTAAIADGNVTTGKIATGAVAAWVASLGAGEVGTYAWLQSGGNNVTYTAGTLYGGGNFAGYRSATFVATSGVGTAGTWRAMGTVPGALGEKSNTLFLRVA